MTMPNQRALIMAGGTGGHVFPGLAVAEQLAQRGWHIEWLGTAERMEADLVPRYGYRIHFIDIKGVRGNGLLRKLTAPFKILKAVMQARTVLKKLQPQVVIGMGGYASGPGALAAKLAGIPVVLHEQNAVAGLTNRYVAKFADQVLMAFAGAFDSGEVVGNPVRASLMALSLPELAKQRPLRLLVVGGSLGAKVLNDVVPEALALLIKECQIEVWHQAGKGNGETIKNSYQHFGIEPYHADDFIHNIDEAYQWCDLVVCRAGALTVSELAAIGRASILVPLPHAVDDHQTKNAQVLVQAGAGILMPQSELSPAVLAQQIEQLAKQPQRLLDMANAGRDVAKQDAAERMASLCQRVVRG
ncbi:UDP-N-acetylglucosamine--N-acetylmuramyl-(pentapeptide) pyrophosphoryl-undecaprenol N-acetylglucosamine transferase [Neiella marina]|uniref:UDP-N-acetylglucosamine--N-acetylmuramyl-(pentapeptide) pyrophosphoryl-undecaprenol N-acetylglucosamine transferase n=1 Tax=Neiella marina TaxID=508461 RepID=A0A8J2XNS9_9GAMM|nr:undecaprenyldiphospho-muramoylpentapeptide beta-N-acetylglucosaminyltransferase [Neiella marina]GGA74435.1 UDP-N-acetylglucosamine--N-acetylmuramyl-(pentapeptide) pyrophosphoryl-undecaprenol N-acetylglucosamine transferase [Neiella marina]